MKKIIFILCTIFIEWGTFSQTRKLSFKTPQTDTSTELVTPEVQQMLYFPTGHGGIFITDISWSPSSNYIASTSSDHTLKLWDVIKKKEIKCLSYSVKFGSKCIWSPDERYVCCGEGYGKGLDGNGNLAIFDVQTGKQVSCINSATEPQCYAGNGKYIIAVQDFKIKMFDVFTGTEIRTFFFSGRWGQPYVSISADETTIAITLRTDNKIWLYDVMSGYQKCVYELEVSQPVGSGWKNQNILVWSNHDSFAEIIDLNSRVTKKIKFTERVESAAWNPTENSFVCDGTVMGYGNNINAAIFDAFTGNCTKKIISKINKDNVNGFTGDTSERVSWSPNGKYIATDGRDSSLHIFEAKTGDEIHTFVGGSKFKVEDISWSSDGKFFISSNHSDLYNAHGQNVKIWNTISAVKEFSLPDKISKNTSWPAYSVSYSPNCEYIAAVYFSEKGMTIFNANSTTVYCSFKDVEAGELLSWNPNNNFIAVANNSYNSKEIRIYNIKNKTLLHTLKMPKTEYSNINSISYSPDGKYISAAYGGDIYIWDSVSGKKINLLSDSGYDFSWSPDGRMIASSSYLRDRCGIRVYNVENWELAYYYNTGDEEVKHLDWDPTGKYIAFSSDNRITLFDVNQRKVLWKNINFSSDVTCVKFNPNGTAILTGEEKGILKLLNVKNGEVIYTIILGDNGDWLTYIPEGYFNGSEGGINKFVHLVNGMEVSELGQYAETLFRPDLVAAKIRGEDISKEEGTTSLAELVSTGEAPLVSFVNPPPATNNRDITVNFNVQDMGGGIGSVYLKINGKVIQLADGSRKLELVGGSTSTTQKSSGKTTQFSHLLTLQNGENTLEAYATNSAGKIESLHATATITWQGKTAKPNLYVLAVGVNKYRDRSLWLNYAVPDATSIADQFRSVKGNLYQSINVTSIFDGDVTANGISSAFNSLASKVGADDVFIFYLSGHGTTHTDGDYYFIPVDFRFRNAQSVPETAISKHFITENLSKIKAQKSLVMLDTCNSGAFISTGARGMAEKTAIDRLSRATGQATIAASSDTQSAMEGYEGHGIFTYVILEGLSGKADTNKDGYVSLSELSQYAEEKVPDYSYAKWGYEQYPQVDLRKQSNFPLVGK